MVLDSAAFVAELLDVHIGMNAYVSPRSRYTFFIDEDQRAALAAIKERDGVSEGEQIRRAIKAWIEHKGRRQRSARIPEIMKTRVLRNACSSTRRGTTRARRRERRRSSTRGDLPRRGR